MNTSQSSAINKESINTNNTIQSHVHQAREKSSYIEKQPDSDGKWYTEKEFSTYYGTNYTCKWNTAKKKFEKKIFSFNEPSQIF